jgi:hypothetical protein
VGQRLAQDIADIVFVGFQQRAYEATDGRRCE